MRMDFEDPKYRIETERLILRLPRAEDFPPLAEQMADEELARHLGGVQTEAQAWRSLNALIGHWHVRGFGFFSVLEKESGQWVGRVGPLYPHQWPEREVGWTISQPFWRKGYAKEAAIASMDFVFSELGWDKVAHLIAHDNIASQGVAKSIGSKPMYEITELPGYGPVEATVWGQTREEWEGR